MINKEAIDPHALNFFRMLKSAGFSAYFVGGAVRDLLLGKNPKDFDIATNATPHQIKRVIPHGKIIGRRFRHVMLEKEGGRYEIVTFRGPVVEKGDANKAKKRYPDLNQFGNAEQDASRRDFTINALFYDPDADELVDYVGGKVDVDNRVVRTIGNATDRMKDDPIRILRAIRHKVKLDLDYSPDLKDAIATTSAELSTTSKDRIREEVLKVCNDRSLGAFLAEARNLAVLKEFAPWFQELSAEEWDYAQKLWKEFEAFEPDKELQVHVGLSVMMFPTVRKTIFAAFEERIPAEKREAGMLPDMKFFLGSEKIRTWLLRVLRISKIQTDIILRSCFYASRMSSKWFEDGAPPKRIEGRLRQQSGAYIGAFVAALHLRAEGKEVPKWILDLAENLWKSNSNRQKQNQEGKKDRDNRKRRDQGKDRGDRNDRSHSKSKSRNRDRDSGDDHNDAHIPVALPVLETPLEWNGPLHTPALRPIFNDTNTSNNLHPGKTLPYRPSGIPLPPVDRAIESSYVVKNYKPEFPDSETPEEDDSQSRSSNDNRRENRKGTGGRRGGRRGNNRSRDGRPNNDDDDNRGNTNSSRGRDEEDYDADEDNIGNLIDGPATSGHSGPLGEQDYSGSEMLTSHMNRSQGNRNENSNARRGGSGGGHRRGGGRSRGGGRRSSRKKTSSRS